MTRRRRRRWLRDEAVAPWITMAVILGMWWAGARFMSDDPAETVPAPRSTDAVPAARGESHVVDGRDDSRPPQARDTSNVADAILSEGRPAGVASLDDLLVPVAGIQPSALRTSFHETRGGGRRHEAIDILAARGTPVYAALDGRVAKLFTSAAGGLTIYQFDPSEEYALYYAHLDSYAADLTEGQMLVRGQTIGYVGTTGNAPPGTPHLHFAVFKLGPEKRWWEGVPLDPFPLLSQAD